MPMRRTIGMSLAFLVISAGAVAKTPEKHPSHHPGQVHGAKPGKTEARRGKTRFASCNVTHLRSRAWRGAHHSGPVRHKYVDSNSSDYASAGPPDAYLGQVHATGGFQIGTAAWYNWVGSRTASGEILDRVTATAAHRSLPLASYARVTNLDTGRSVIVKINDRGPWIRRFIIDLSPRAASALDVIRSGVAAVIVEPVAIGPTPTGETAPTLAAFQDATAGLQ
jgi:rare lipoprotein A (peptidoglycan hydrolase)